VKSYVALLRGINLGAHKRISMEDLRELFRALGTEEVRTYLQSGNVVFRSNGTPSELVRAIEKGINRSLGLEVTVLVRTRRQLAKVVRANPFLASKVDPAKLHVTFFADAPDADRVRALGEKRVAPDEFHLVGSEIYLYCPKGYGRTKVSNTFLEKQLSVAATTRNWKTVTALAEMAKG
jgi:uncharacterized protein (DUF1697 family)